MNLVYDPEAEDELRAAAERYEAARAGLGDRFLAKIAHAVERIAEAPLSFPVYERLGGENIIRRVLVDDFPFAVVFLPVANEVYLLAVMHLRREPGYWAHRVSGR